MYNIIALIGEAGSGKDFMMRKILDDNPEFNEVISCTSRPPRDNEQNGVNYYYYSEKEFLNKIKNNDMFEYTIFNNWYYGTGKDSVDKNKINIGVFNPEGIRSLLKRKDCNIIVFRVRTSDKERFLRQLTREKEPDIKEIIRRFNTDVEDFSNIDFDYITIPNNHIDNLIFGAKEIVEQSRRWFARGQN